MSVVLEALEKAQRESSKKPKEKEEKNLIYREKIRKEQRVLSPAPAKRSYSKYIWVVVITANICFLGMLLYWNFIDEIVDRIEYKGAETIAVRVPVLNNVPLPQQIKPVALEKPMQKEIVPPVVIEDNKEAEVNSALPPELAVSGIMWDENDPIALINGRFMRRGDQIKGAEVKEIGTAEVKFVFNDEEITVLIQ